MITIYITLKSGIIHVFRNCAKWEFWRGFLWITFKESTIDEFVKKSQIVKFTIEEKSLKNKYK
jgi:hypothetical protein